MLWLLLLAPALAAVAIGLLLPVAPIRAARRSVRRLDGTESLRRALVERASLRRYLLHGVVVPLGASAGASVLMFGLYAFVPWTPLAHVFGEHTPETALISQTLVDAHRERAEHERRARLEAAAAAGEHTGAWWHAAQAAQANTRFNLLVLLSLVGLYAVLGRYAWRARNAYRDAARKRRRRYARADRQRIETAL